MGATRHAGRMSGYPYYIHTKGRDSLCDVVEKRVRVFFRRQRRGLK